MTRLWEKDTSNSQVIPHDPGTDSTEGLEGARRDMRPKRLKASECLGQLQKKSNPTGSEVAQMKAMHQAYERCGEGRGPRTVFELRHHDRRDNPGAGMRAWGEKVARMLIERRAFDATVGGTMVDPFFDANLRRLPARLADTGTVRINRHIVRSGGIARLESFMRA